MIIPNKFSGYVAGKRYYNGGGKGGGGDYSGVSAALDRQTEMGNRLTDFIMKAYEDNKPLVEEAAANARVDRVRQLELSDKAEKRGDELYDFYQTKGKPVVEKALDDAANWDSASNINRVREAARADATEATDSAMQQQNRMLTRMGINPNSGKFAALNNEMQLKKAAMVAGGVNNAETQQRTQAAELRGNASNIANGLVSTSANLSGQSSGMGATANGMAGQPLGFTQSNQAPVSSGMTSAANIYGNVASGRLNLANSKAQNEQDAWGGLGSLAGTVIGSAKSGQNAGILAFADGGPVEGAGTGTSDDVPAVNTDNGGRIQLSNGEYVISADVVKAKGREFFDKLQEKYHTPVGNIGRATA